MKIQNWQISNSNLVLSDSVKSPAGFIISAGKISKFTDPGEEIPDLLQLNLNGLNVYPALMNSFDSLFNTYDFIRGENWPYMNWLAYDNEVKLSEAFQEKMLFDAHTLYLLGAYKNLLGGSVFVVDHIPHFVRQPFQDQMPVSFLKDYGIAHSVCSYSPKWGEGIEKEYRKAEKLGIPFIVRIGEGIDSENVSSLQNLKKEGGLGKHTVLVNCLSLNDQDIKDIADAHASIVWCPSSNQKIYEKTIPVEKLLDAGVNLCLGTDSSMRGSTGMIDEIKAAALYFQNDSNLNLRSSDLFRMCTINASSALFQPERGELKKNAFADFLVLSQRGKNPYDALLNSGISDIFLLVHNGVPLLGDLSLERIFLEMKIPVEKIIVDDRPKLIIDGLGEMLDLIKRSLKYEKSFSFLPVHLNESEN